jgi:hypothetical protein
MARKGDPDRVEDADVEIGASVRAKRLRFRERPKAKVELHGEVREPEGRGEPEVTSGSERQNLPAEVEPGVTYRDVRVRWRAAARLDGPGAKQDSKRVSSKQRSRR